MPSGRTHPAAYPRGEDLPDTDGKPLDNEIHRAQATTYLIDPLKMWLSAHGRSAFVGGNSCVFYDRKKPAIGPDFYVVNGGQQSIQTKWVAWEEQNLIPTLVLEMLSPKTEAKDRGSKFLIYRDELRCPDYFLLKSEAQALEGFHLVGRAYVVVTPDSHGRLACSSLPLKLGFHNGWLRFFEPDGTLVPTEAEQEHERAGQEQQRAEQEHERAEQERQRAEQERQRAERAEEEVRRLRAELDRLRPPTD